MERSFGASGVRTSRSWGPGRRLCAIAVVGAVAAGLSSVSPHATAGDVRRPPPASAPPPGRVFNSISALAQTAAIVEGTASQISSEYTEQTGPWTRLEFTDVVVHRGRIGAEPLAFVQRGGLYPDGRRLKVSHVPEFVAGARYLMFLRNTRWNLSPIVGGYALRVDAEGLIGQQGGVLMRFSESGPSYSPRLFSQPDMNGSPPARLLDRTLPSQIMSTGDVLDAVDVQLAIWNRSIEGDFYNEPARRERRRRVAPAAPAIPANMNNPTAGEGPSTVDEPPILGASKPGEEE
jgi:hypothetical protein